jgi:sugar/nucleoside kinase (ribokinase family)
MGGASVPRPRVAVIGNLCWDVVVRGLPALPRWGQEVEGHGNAQAPGGQGYNLAAALAALGVAPRLVGAVGRDATGAAMLAASRTAGIDVAGVLEDAEEPTAVTTALVRRDGERAFASDFGCQRRFGLEQVASRWALIEGSPVACLVGLFNMPGMVFAGAADCLGRARSAGATTVLDTGWDILDWPRERIEATLALLADVDVFLPNLDEARALTGLDDAAASAAALAEHGPSTVVVKCGGAGSVGLREGELTRVAALPVTVRDAVGAGDTFDAGFLAGLLDGCDLAACQALGSAAAGLRISGAGTSWPARDAVEAAAARLRDTSG